MLTIELTAGYKIWASNDPRVQVTNSFNRPTSSVSNTIYIGTAPAWLILQVKTRMMIMIMCFVANFDSEHYLCQIRSSVQLSAS